MQRFYYGAEHAGPRARAKKGLARRADVVGDRGDERPHARRLAARVAQQAVTAHSTLQLSRAIDL